MYSFDELQKRDCSPPYELSVVQAREVFYSLGEALYKLLDFCTVVKVLYSHVRRFVRAREGRFQFVEFCTYKFVYSSVEVQVDLSLGQTWTFCKSSVRFEQVDLNFVQVDLSFI